MPHARQHLGGHTASREARRRSAPKAKSIARAGRSDRGRVLPLPTAWLTSFHPHERFLDAAVAANEGLGLLFQALFGLLEAVQERVCWKLVR